MQKFKTALMGLAKKNVFLRRIMKSLYKAYKRTIYLKYYIGNKTKNNLIVFESFMGRAYSDSQKALYKEMLNEEFFNNFTFVWAFKHPEKYEFLKENKNTVIVKYGSKEFMKYMAKAKYWITNSRLPEYLIKKKKQKYIQCWHGTPLKRLGFDIKVEDGNALNTTKEIKEKYEDDAKRYNYMLSPSKFCTEKFISAFNLKKLKKEKCIVELGYPRNDFLFNYTEEYVNDLKEKLGIPKNKKVILYAPTWRDNQHTAGVGYTYNLNIDFDKLKEKLQDEYVIIFRTHYFISNSFDFEKYKGFIFNMSDHDDVNDCYILSDILITDYSSVFFDYANLKRPMIFYMYDLDEYQGKLRDFYFSLDKLPGPIVKTEEDLLKAILNVKENEKKYSEKYKEFNDEFNYLDSGDCSKNVLEKIFLNRHLLENILVNFAPIFFKHKNKMGVISSCAYRIKNEYAKKKMDKYILIDNKKIPVKMLLKRGIRLFKFGEYTYFFNIYKFSVDIEFLKTCPIQNNIKINFECDEVNLELLTVYNIIYLKKGYGHTGKLHEIPGTDLVCFFRQGNSNSFNITVRNKNITDHFDKRVKIFFAWALSKFTFKSKKTLLYEKECNKYEESAAYLYERLIDMGYKNVYYIIHKDSPHVRFIKPKYMKNIIWAHTFRHYLEFFRCKKFIATESMAQAIEVRIANYFVTKKLQKKKYKFVFLQHGVMYMVSLDAAGRGFFRKGKAMPKDSKIVVSSKLEAKHFVDLGNFDYEDLYVTGLPFYDRTIKKDTADKIVIMPTWRPWDYNTLCSDCENSSYYKFVLNIYNSVPDNLKDKVILLPHPVVINIFKNTPLGKLVPEVISYDLILEDTALLITDYSSISYSAFYRGANVIFVWNEKDECMEYYGGHLMLNEENVFGDYVYEYVSLKEKIENNYLKPQTDNNKERYSKIVEFHDNKNTERLIGMLKRDKFI